MKRGEHGLGEQTVEGSEDKDEHTECPEGRERNTEAFQK